MDAELDIMLGRHPSWDGTIQQPPVQLLRSPAPTAPASAPGRGMGSGDVEQWRSLVAAYFVSEDVDRVLCLIGYESGGNPAARNVSSHASGLLQIMPFWADEYGVSKADLFVPEINLSIGRGIRDSQGWTAWSPYNRGLCRN